MRMKALTGTLVLVRYGSLPIFVEIIKFFYFYLFYFFSPFFGVTCLQGKDLAWGKIKSARM